MTDSFWEILKLALSGAFGGTLGGAIVAWSNWGVEKRRQKLNYQRELVSTWRKLISSTQANYLRIQSTEDQDVTFAELIERSADYFSLKPHLSQHALDALNDESSEETIKLVKSGRKLKINPPDAIVDVFVDEIARIEAEWDLV